MIFVNKEQICGDKPFSETDVVFLLHSWWWYRNSNQSCSADGGVCILHLFVMNKCILQATKVVIFTKCLILVRGATCSLIEFRQQIFEQDGEAIVLVPEFKQCWCYMKLLLAGICGDDSLTFNIKELQVPWILESINSDIVMVQVKLRRWEIFYPCIIIQIFYGL